MGDKNPKINKRTCTSIRQTRVYPGFCEWKGTYCHDPGTNSPGRSADTLGEGLLETINQDRWDKDE